MTFPQKEINLDGKKNKNDSIQERVLWEEKLLEEKTLSVNENILNPYEDFNLNLQNIDVTFKNEYKHQIALFNSNFKE